MVQFEGGDALRTDLFDETIDLFTGPPVTPEAIDAAESSLHVRLPASYVDLLHERNGGALRRRCFFVPFATSWAQDHFCLDAILGVGGQCGIDLPVGGSRHLVQEWGYPDVGVVIGLTPSGDHDTVMLDYRPHGRSGEPAIIYVDEDRIPRPIAASFAEFLEGLSACPPCDVD